MVRITRREFLKYCSVAAGALGLSASTLMKLDQALALNASDGGVPVVWLAGAACTGCTMTLTNSAFYTTIEQLLFQTLDLKYLDTLMATAGSYVNGNEYTGANSVVTARQAYLAAKNNGTPLVLCVEGAIQVGTPFGGNPGEFCEIGEMVPAGNDPLVGDGDATFMHAVEEYASVATAVLAIGTCASFGGIPNGRGSLTDAKGLMYKGTSLSQGFLATASNAVKSKVINISGCPPHPDWIVGTIAHILSTAITLPPLTSYRRPVDYGYGSYQCNAGPCPWRYNNVHLRAKNNNTSLIDEPDYNSRYPQGDSQALGRNKYTGTDLGCLGILGCKGRKTKADCSKRRWNTTDAENYGVNWCVGTRGGCHGCTEPTFPDKVGRFFTFK